MNQGYLEIVAEYGLPTGYQHIGQKYMWDAKKWGEWEELWQDPKKPMILPDVQTDDRFIKREGSEYIRSWMGIPMAVGDKVFGLINIDNRKLNFYTEEHSAIIQTFANQAGIAIEKARLFETEKRHHREAELLREATASLATTLEFQPLLDTILEAISEFVVHDSASIFLENSQEEMEIAAVRGISNPENFVGEKVPKTEKWYQLATSHQALIIENSQIDTPLEKWEGAKYIRSWMSIPMTAQDKMIGYINLDSHRVNAFTERDATIAQTFANSAAIAIGNARLYQDAVQAAERRAVLHRISQDIIRFSQDIEQIYVAIHEAAGKLMPCDVFLITLRDEAKGENVSVYTVEAGDRYKLQGVPANQGLSAVVINNGKSIILRNEAEIGRREVFHFGSPRHVQSVAAVPMRINDKVIGMISAQCYEPYAYDIEEQALLEMLATHAATAIENGRLFESEQKRRQEAETLRQAATAISSTLDLNHVMKDILKALQQVIHYDNASVFLHEGDWLRLAVCQGFPNFENLVNQKFPANDELFEQIQETRRPIIITDAQKDPRFKNWGGSLQIHGWMAVPLITRGKVIGYISLDNYEPGAYNEANTETAMAFANQAAAGIENARLYDETQRRLKELEIINRISASLRMTQSVDEMLPILLNETLELINTPHGSIWLYDHYTDMLMQRVASGAEAKLKHTSIRPSEGIVGHTFRTEKKYTSYELKNDLLLFEGNRDSVTGGLGGICIPIQSTAGPVGVLMLSIETGRQIKEELNLLTILAEITGNSIHRAQLYDQSQRQVRRLTSLRDIDAAIASSFDLRLTLNILMDQTLSHLNVDAVDIGLYHPDLQILTYLTGVGFNVPSPTRPQVRLGEGLAGQVLIKQETYHVTDMQKAAGTKDELLIKREKFVTYIGVPLIVKGQIKGIFEVFHRSPLSTTPDWMEFLHTLAGQAAIAIDSSQLFENLQRSNQELIQAYDTTLEGWARALELRDRETEGHTRRVTELTLRLARYMKIGENEMVNIHRGVLLHDIGKMGVPDHILKKTGKLTDDEWGEMRQHPIYAYNLLSPILFLRGVLDIPYCHHEHWDGSGYPRGLKGEQIPLAARIFSVVDIWDALLSDRPYRKAWPRKAVIDYLQEVAGKILDPKIVPIFLTMIHTDEEQTG